MSPWLFASWSATLWVLTLDRGKERVFTLYLKDTSTQQALHKCAVLTHTCCGLRGHPGGRQEVVSQPGRLLDDNQVQPWALVGHIAMDRSFLSPRTHMLEPNPCVTVLKGKPLGGD